MWDSYWTRGNEIFSAAMTGPRKNQMFFTPYGYTDLATWKTWLSSHNLEVYYVLATPTYEIITSETLINQLEELTKLDTYNNYSAVTVTGDLINPELECVLFSQPAYQK